MPHSMRTMSSIGMVMCILALATCARAEHTFLGCYHDKFSPSDRDLGGMVALEESKMTPEFCESICGVRHQYKYFGVQYGMECWCGNSYGRHGRLASEGTTPATGCVSKCTGDPTRTCGGENLNSVYEITSQYTPAPPHPDGRPLLGLVMIVKDEAHTLPATLLAIKPWIDVYYILDTGSTDGTQAAIKRTLGDKGEVWEEPFIDYGRSRNRALEIAQTTKTLGGPPVFSLMLSADETIHNGEELRKFCEEHRDKQGPTEEAYYMSMDVGWRFDSARLSRTDKGWRYVGRVHEYLAGPNGRGAPAQRVPSTYIKFKVTDEERRGQREYIILSILQEETRDHPSDTRSSFYLARTYNVVKNHTAALAEFQRRVSLGGWREEVYESLYAIAWQKEALHAPWSEVQQAFLDAHAHSPERAEPLYAIASHWYKEKNPALAYLFASHASTLIYPVSASLWVQADVYGWQCQFLVGMTGLDVHKDHEGARALAKAMVKRPKDQAMIHQAGRYRSAIGEERFQQYQCDADHLNCRPGQEQSALSTSPHAARAAAELHSAVRVEPHAISVTVAHPDGDVGSSNLPAIYCVIAFLAVVNVVLVFALRKGKGATGCLTQGILQSADKQV